MRASLELEALLLDSPQNEETQISPFTPAQKFNIALFLQAYIGASTAYAHQLEPRFGLRFLRQYFVFPEKLTDAETHSISTYLNLSSSQINGRAGFFGTPVTHVEQGIHPFFIRGDEEVGHKLASLLKLYTKSFEPFETLQFLVQGNVNGEDHCRLILAGRAPLGYWGVEAMLSYLNLTGLKPKLTVQDFVEKPLPPKLRLKFRRLKPKDKVINPIHMLKPREEQHESR